MLGESLESHANEAGRRYAILGRKTFSEKLVSVRNAQVQCSGVLSCLVFHVFEELWPKRAPLGNTFKGNLMRLCNFPLASWCKCSTNAARWMHN